MALSTTNLAPSSGVIFGSWCRERYPEDFSGGTPVSIEQIHYNFENRIGRQMGLVGSYMHFDDWKTSFPGSYQQRWANGGRLLFFRWKPDQAPGVAKWQDIADGVYDSYLTTAFTNMMNWQGGTGAGAVDTNKFLLAFHHEFDGDDYQTYGNAGDTAAQGLARYKAAFNHIRSVRNSVGATNALLCWVVTGGSTFNQDKWLPAYPGDANVDWIGFEPYNLYCITGSNWRWPTENWNAFLNWAQTNAPTPPIMIGEFGVGEHADASGSLLTPSKAEWFRDGTQGVIPTLKKAPYSRIKAVSYFNSSLNATDIRCEAWINSTTDSSSGFITMANDPLMFPDMSVGGGGGGGVTPPGTIVPRAFSTNSNASSATPTVTVPATTKGGDIIGVFFSTNSTGATINSFTSSYQLFSEVDDGTSQRTNIAWKIAAGTLGAASSDASTAVGPTLSTTGIKTELFCFVYSGTANAPLTAVGINETTTQTTHTTPSLTTADNGSWVLSIWSDRGTVVSGVATNTTQWALPAGETMRAELYMTGSASPTMIASDTNQPHGPGTYGGKVANSDFSNNNAVQWTVLIKAAASSTTPPGTGDIYNDSYGFGGTGSIVTLQPGAVPIR